MRVQSCLSRKQTMSERLWCHWLQPQPLLPQPQPPPAAAAPLPQCASFSGDQWGQTRAGTEHASKASRGAGVIFSEIPGSHAGLLTPGLPSSKKSEKILRSFSTLAMNFTPQCRWEMSFTNGQDESQFGTPS